MSVGVCAGAWEGKRDRDRDIHIHIYTQRERDQLNTMVERGRETDGDKKRER